MNNSMYLFNLVIVSTWSVSVSTDMATQISLSKIWLVDSRIQRKKGIFNEGLYLFDSKL